MKKKSDNAKHNIANEEEDCKYAAEIIYKKVIQTDIYDDAQRNIILEIVNRYIDDFNSQIVQNDSTEDDGFTTVSSTKKKSRSRYEDYYRFKGKVCEDIQSAFRETTRYTMRQLNYFKMELSNQELNLILNFLSTVINMVEPLIYDDIKPVAQECGVNKYNVYIEYFPRSNLTQSYEQCMRERLEEDDKFKNIARAYQIRQGLIKNNFQQLDLIPGFYEDCHIEFKNIGSLNGNEMNQSEEMKGLEKPQNLQNQGEKEKEGDIQQEQMKTNSAIENNKVLIKSPLGKGDKAHKILTYEECFNKFLQTIVAMMNTQGGSIFIPIKENQNAHNNQLLYSVGQINMSEIELKNKIRSCFDEIVFYRMNCDAIEEQERTQEIVSRLIPDINCIRDENGNIRVYEVIVYQVYPEFICNLEQNKVSAEIKQKNNHSKESNYEFPIRRSAANCTIVFSKDQMRLSLGKASHYNKLKNNLSLDEQKRLFYSKFNSMSE